MKPDIPFASGVLDKEVHARLVADIENIAADAGILPHWIWTSLAATGGVAKKEGVWIKRFRFHSAHDKSGLVLSGKFTELPVELHMAAIAGALTRNFIRAKVMSVNAFIDLVNDGNVPDMSCVLIPNFYVAKSLGGHMPEWRVSVLLDGLMQRHAGGLQTVVGASGMDTLAADYGIAVQRHLKAAYEVIPIN